MIELVSNIHGDCTSDYEIIHSPLDTVGDIIYHATENNEWGNFVINGERFYSGKYIIMPEEIYEMLAVAEVGELLYRNLLKELNG